ncbi:MAG: adenylosuccinate synthetase [Clostridia bacterium]|nr:adenylosuccinate synthetase [Clostridia bacterium]
MKNIKVVIGANFGDEGKGLLTDYLASRMEQGIVIRFNGGTQAGHTVTTPEGLRHVFGHIGSGSFVGLPTYLSSFFVANPMTFRKEMNSFIYKGISPKVYIDKDCLLTTPYDMMINQVAEITRGTSKHGSCGLGFNETIHRSLQDEFKLSVMDIYDEKYVRSKLYEIKNWYVPGRLTQLGINDIPLPYIDLLSDEGIIESYLDDISYLIKMATLTDSSILSSFDNLLFEGAQGLLLDQSHKYFPHVTRSNTGMKNVRELIKHVGYANENIEVVYVTRAYLTRHGAGPFPTELPEKPYTRIEDVTNVPNPYQGALRFGVVDLDILAEAINQDLINAEGLNCNVKLAITCLDQLDGEVDYFVNSYKSTSSVDDFIHKALKALNISDGYVSFGPTRETLSCIKV